MTATEISNSQKGFGPAVGDTTSDKPGTGARFNAGKVPMEMIPVWIVANYVTGQFADHKDPNVREACKVLRQLGEWQRGLCSANRVLHALPAAALADAARVFKYACTEKATPYPMWNWAKGMPWSVPTACAVRHLLAITGGEYFDPDTKLPHLGHVACNLIMLVQYEDSYKEGDDRPTMIQKGDPRQEEMFEDTIGLINAGAVPWRDREKGPGDMSLVDGGPGRG